MSIQNTYGLTEYNSFFEIPIYRLSNDEFVSELEKEIDKSWFFSKEDLESSFPGEGEKRHEKQRSELECTRGYKWKFNEIIGWLTLNKSDNSIAGEVFLKNGIRITKKNKSKIDFYDCGFLVSIVGKTNSEILELIISEIKLFNKNPKFKKRYIDLSKLETIGLYVDWNNLFKSLK